MKNKNHWLRFQLSALAVVGLFYSLQAHIAHAALITGTFTGVVNDIATWGGPELNGKVAIGDVLTGSFSYSTDNYFLTSLLYEDYYYLQVRQNYVQAAVNGLTFASSDSIQNTAYQSEVMLREGRSPATGKNIEITGYGDSASFDISPYGGLGIIRMSLENYYGLIDSFPH